MWINICDYLTRIRNRNYLKKVFKLILFGVLVFIGLSDCKKNQAGYYDVEGSFKEWVLFQKGSYWIFMNEGNHTTDSTIIRSPPVSWYTPPADENVDHYEEIYFSFKNSFILTEYIWKEPDYSYAAIGCFYPPNADYRALNSAFINGQSNSGLTVYTTLVERIDTMLLNNNKFFNVLHTRSIDAGQNYLQNDYYFVKNIGLVKFSMKTNAFDSTWSVLRWHIVQ